jgi:hypothetical protein
MTDENQPPSSDGRRSVTVPLPSSNGLVALIASVIVILLVAALVLEGARLHDANHDKSTLKAELNGRPAATAAGTGLNAEAQSAISTATTYAEQFSTYNYKSLTTDFGLTESHALEPFLSKYKSETAQIRPDLVKLKATSSGKVIGAGIASITPSTAVVDLFLNQTISNSASTQPRVDNQRVEMTLTKQANRWLISKVVLP